MSKKVWIAGAAAASFGYVGYAAFIAGVMANAMPALSTFGVAVIGGTAPVVTAINAAGGNVSGVDFVPPDLRDDLYEFGKDATSLIACDAAKGA